MKKQFKTESKKMLDMMINSIYTHKEIFLRELISNASDAIDKRYFRSLTEPSVGLNREEYRIFIERDKEARTLASNFTWLAILKIIAYLFPLITLPYLARVIGVDGFGEIAFAVSVMIFIETFVDFGFNYTATRDIARQRNDILAVSKVFSNVMWAKILLMCIGFGILCLLIWKKCNTAVLSAIK